jgi:hypothetical protein
MGVRNCQSQGQAGPYKHPEDTAGVVGQGQTEEEEGEVYMGRKYAEPETPD